MKSFWVVLFSLFFLSFATALAVPPPECVTDADCDDGQFCNGTEYCEAGTCVAVSACPPRVEGCAFFNNSCDEENDQCVDFYDDSQCAADEFCAPSGDCLALGQDVGSQFCGHVQSDAQDAVADGGPYRNHGQMVKTAANVVSPYSESWKISEECSSCIVNQFARRIALNEQEPCGALCPVDIVSVYPDLLDIDFADINCWPYAFVVSAEDSDAGVTTIAALYNADIICELTPGPGLCYQHLIGPVYTPVDDTPLTPEEFTACEEVLRNYGEDLEDAGLLDEGTVAGCPLVDPLGGGN